MKKLLLVLCLWSGSFLQAQTTWFNIMGEPDDAAVDTVEVNPTPVSINGAIRALQVRVGRSADQLSRDGVSYRSYASEVVSDCVSNSTRHAWIDFYTLPGWKGEPHKRAVYPLSDPRPMQFPEIEPNPYRRIVRPACQTGSVINN